MKKRSLLMLAAFALTLFAVAAPWLLVPHGPRFSAEQQSQLKRGMTEAEVTAILGCPDGDYTAGQAVYLSFIDPYAVADLRINEGKSWCGPHGAIAVKFGVSGQLEEAYFFPAANPPPTLAERIKGWVSFGK
jgi:hypothetical protein